MSTPEDGQDWSKHVGTNISTILLLFYTSAVLRSSGLNGEVVVQITGDSGPQRETMWCG
jgi:hypothetical protein